MTELSPLPFALPDIGEEEIAAVAATMRSGWITTGPRVREFEDAFAAKIGDGLHAVAVNSATAGLHLALEALGVGRGDNVLVPTWTFTATAEVARYLGAEVRLVDVDRRTLNIDLGHAASLVDDRTKAIMPVHFAGRAMSAQALSDWGAAHPGVAVVEDAAHAFPAASEGAKVGSSNSHATVFSFYATKTIATGEGGMLLTPSGAIADRARTMRLHGIDRDAFNRYRSTVPAWQYDVVAPGYKYNMTDIAASIGLVQLNRAEEMRRRREEIANHYSESLGDLPIELPNTGDMAADDVHAWHLYVMRLNAPDDRDEFIRRLAAEGIGSSVHFIPLHLLRYWKRRRLGETTLPVATEEFARVVSLPLYSKMSDLDVERVVHGVRRVLRA